MDSKSKDYKTVLIHAVVFFCIIGIVSFLTM